MSCTQSENTYPTLIYSVFSCSCTFVFHVPKYQNQTLNFRVVLSYTKLSGLVLTMLSVTCFYVMSCSISTPIDIETFPLKTQYLLLDVDSIQDFHNN